MQVTTTFDITPLRSFVAIAASGGFHRAATALHLTQSAVSQHVRRLEQASGRTLVERVGRQMQFTADGQALVEEARRILAAHDDAVRRFEVGPTRPLVIGASEHVAEMLLPEVTAALSLGDGGRPIRYRLDKTETITGAVDSGAVDVAIVPQVSDGEPDERGSLRLRWYAANGWVRPEGALPVVLFDAPCILRAPTVDTLNDGSVQHRIDTECANLAGAHAACRSGLGVLLLPTLGRAPEGLREVTDLPAPPAVRMIVRATPDLPRRILRDVERAVRTAMAG